MRSGRRAGCPLYRWVAGRAGGPSPRRSPVPGCRASRCQRSPARSPPARVRVEGGREGPRDDGRGSAQRLHGGQAAARLPRQRHTHGGWAPGPPTVQCAVRGAPVRAHGRRGPKWRGGSPPHAPDNLRGRAAGRWEGGAGVGGPRGGVVRAARVPAGPADRSAATAATPAAAGSQLSQRCALHRAAPRAALTAKVTEPWPWPARTC